jgi:hypothetical protein
MLAATPIFAPPGESSTGSGRHLPTKAAAAATTTLRNNTIKTCRRLSMESTANKVQKTPKEAVDAAYAAVQAAAADSYTRRASLDVNVEYAVAMVNAKPELNDDVFISPFGNRRDSMTTTANSRERRTSKRILKKQTPEKEDKDEIKDN